MPLSFARSLSGVSTVALSCALKRLSLFPLTDVKNTSWTNSKIRNIDRLLIIPVFTSGIQSLSLLDRFMVQRFVSDG
jgi:hypothetical protein